MPNIITTNFCNLKCPYCFASTMMDSPDASEISLEQLQNILSWLYPTAINQDFSIGVIGGEPTLHSKFLEVLACINNFCSMTNSSSTLFTNGILLHQYLPYIGEDMSILINVNNLQGKYKELLYKSLSLVNKINWFDNNKVTLGCNLHINEFDYNYFWDIVSIYRNISRIRMSVTAPVDKQLKSNKELYYFKMKPILMNFLKKAKEYNLSIIYDCNQIPKCLLSSEELELIASFGNYNLFCDPVIDITPDFKATSCFGCYELVDCTNFEQFEQLYRYFQGRMIMKTQKNKNNFCSNCSKIDLLQCQGGCLSFTS